MWSFSRINIGSASILYLNNVSKIIFSILFADDTSVFIDGDNIELTIKILNSIKSISLADSKQINFKYI